MQASFLGVEALVVEARLLPLRSLTKIPVQYQRAPRRQIQEEQPNKDRVLLPITEEGDTMAVEQLLLTRLVRGRL